MTAPITQQEAINTINNLVTAAQELVTFYNNQSALDLYWNDNGIANMIAAMQTIPLNTDGTLGSTPDSTPNAAHPLNINAYPGLTRTLSPTQITQIKTILDAVVSLLNGNAVTAQGGARAILDAAV